MGDGNVTGPNAETPHAGTRLFLDPQPPIPASTSSTTQVVALQDVSLTMTDIYVDEYQGFSYNLNEMITRFSLGKVTLETCRDLPSHKECISSR
jgi:hypothetical protein